MKIYGWSMTLQQTLNSEQGTRAYSSLAMQALTPNLFEYRPVFKADD